MSEEPDDRDKKVDTGNQTPEVPQWEPSPQLIDTLSEAIKKPFPEQLIPELSAIGSRFYLYRILIDKRPKDSDSIKELKKISKLAKDLSNVLRESNWLSCGMLYDVALTQKVTEPYPFMDNLASDLQKLASWADDPLCKKGGRRKLFADQQLSRELAQLFEEATGGKKASAPSQNSHTGEWDGPFGRFYFIVFEALDNDQKNYELKRDIVRRTMADTLKKTLRKKNQSKE